MNTPFSLGARVTIDAFTAEVRTLTSEQQPLTVAFHFEEPLESESYRFVVWTDAGLEAFELPEPGQSVVVNKALPKP